MTLDPRYLDYPHRKRGMDHDLYGWSNIFDRKPVNWSNGKRVAIWPVISLEWFPMVPSDKPFRAPGHMQTTYPDYRHYTARDYGTRIGLYRLLDAFAHIGAPVSVAMNAAIADRYPALVDHVLEGGHEIIAHSTDMNGAVDSSLDVDSERALIDQTLTKIHSVSGIRPRGWLSIARSQSFATPGLLAEAGVQYMCDWANDELPYQFKTPAGYLANLPLNHELSDRQILNVQQQSIDSYVEQMTDAFDWLDAEAKTCGGRMLPMHLTPYIMGLPYRIDGFETLLERLALKQGAWFARGDHLLDQWLTQV